MNPAVSAIVVCAIAMRSSGADSDMISSSGNPCGGEFEEYSAIARWRLKRMLARIRKRAAARAIKGQEETLADKRLFEKYIELLERRPS